MAEPKDSAHEMKQLKDVGSSHPFLMSLLLYLSSRFRRCNSMFFVCQFPMLTTPHRMWNNKGANSNGWPDHTSVAGAFACSSSESEGSSVSPSTSKVFAWSCIATSGFSLRNRLEFCRP